MRVPLSEMGMTGRVVLGLVNLGMLIMSFMVHGSGWGFLVARIATLIGTVFSVLGTYAFWSLKRSAK